VSAIPQLALGEASGAGSPPPGFVEAVREASAEWGCFTLVDHGISSPLEARFADQTRHFFALPRASKLRVERSAENARGFYDRELTKNRPDWKEVFDYGLRPGPDGEDQWPEGLAGFRETMTEWQAACEGVAFPLLRALAVGMGQPAGALDAYFDRHTSFVRLNHYPLCPDPAPADAPLVPEQGALGVSHHTDAGALTILWQDAMSGLQVQRDGVWTLVEAEPGALIVNLGDMLQVWSNDHYVSPLHRVIASSQRERFSAPFFFNPSADALCRPLSQPARYRPVPWAEFRSLRSSGDYADHGEEVQISHYRREDLADGPELDP
jgi:isopenicillin N synthase-like dioxygenase